MEGSKNILLLDGNSSHCLPIMKSLERKGHTVTLICPSVFSCGYFSRYGQEKLIWPRITEEEEKFYQLLISHIKDKKYDLLMGLSDASSKMLSAKKKEIEHYSKIIIPDFEIFQKAANKFLTMKFCMDNGIPCPTTVDGDEYENNSESSSGNLTFPVVIKPKQGVGAVGFSIIYDRNELERRLPEMKQKFGSMLIQEFIPNEEQYTVEAFCDHSSDLKACVVAQKTRFFPIQGGTSSCNVTADYPEITDTVEKLLQKLNWIGSANVDLIVDPRDKTPKVIEINPRVGAIVKIAFLSGVDIADMSIKMINKIPISNNKKNPSGIVMRNLMLDLLWFIFSSIESKRNTRPSFFKFFGNKLHYQNFGADDPFPFIGYLLSNALKYTDINILKRKLDLK